LSVKIFLSTVSDEFRAYRDQLRADLTRHNVEVKVQEDFKDYAGVTLDKLDVYISACDAVVHLVGDMTGAAAKPASTQVILAKYPDLKERLPPLREPLERGDDISYTQWEAWLALYHGKALLIAQADDAAPRGPKFTPTEASRAAQQAHLNQLRAVERYPGCAFVSPDQLAKQIAYTTILDMLAKEQGGEPFGLALSFPYVDVIGVPLVLLLTPLLAEHWAMTLGIALAAPLALLLALSSLALVHIYIRYFGILATGSEPAWSRERLGYDALRQNLTTGGPAVRMYSRWLTTFLNKVDHFFGDASMADRTLFPRAFGLRAPAPLWTAPAFDRCLLLALIYPTASIFIIWAVSGHVGPAEAALTLEPDIEGWRRGLVVGAMAIVALAFRGARSNLGTAFAVAGVVALAAVTTLAVALPGVAVGVLVVAFAFAFAFARTGAGAVAVAVAGPIAGAGNVAVVVVVAGALAVNILSQISIKYRWQGLFLLLFSIGILLSYLGAVNVLSSRETWNFVGPLSLFLGLLTLINAPFDWFSLGLTRALLRRGLELGGWWPYLLALADALAAAFIIALLAITMVISVQTFDHLAEHASGAAARILSLDKLFDGIAAHPSAPEYWWVYALLLSTMIPSLINLMIGGTALIRAVPGLSPWLLNYLPANGAVHSYDRAWIAAVLTGQITLGVVLGVGVQALLAYGLIFHAMPAVGLGLLDLARGLADLELPTRLIQLFAGPS
jgi:Domain of unknown function (DUF4062)